MATGPQIFRRAQRWLISFGKTRRLGVTCLGLEFPWGSVSQRQVWPRSNQDSHQHACFWLPHSMAAQGIPPSTVTWGSESGCPRKQCWRCMGFSVASKAKRCHLWRHAVECESQTRQGSRGKDRDPTQKSMWVEEAVLATVALHSTFSSQLHLFSPWDLWNPTEAWPVPSWVKELAAGTGWELYSQYNGALASCQPDTKELYIVSHSILMTNCHQGTFLPHFTETWGAYITSPKLREPVQGSLNLNPPT